MNTLYFHSKPDPASKKRRKTIAGVVSDNQLLIGISECSSKDNFNRKLGRTIAQGRAIRRPYSIIELEDNSDKKAIGKLFVQEAINIDNTI